MYLISYIFFEKLNMNNKDHMHRFGHEFKNNINSPAFQAVYISAILSKIKQLFF